MSILSIAKRFGIFSICAFMLVMVACGSEEPTTMEEVDDREGINVLVLTFESPNKEPVVFRFEDLDGTSGNDPVVTTSPLENSTQYFVTATVFRGNENLSPEITAESAEHQFFYDPIDLDIIVTYGDQDGAGFPLGAFMAMRTGEAGTGLLNVNLAHKPNKSGAGVSDGNLLNAGGRTDIQASFPLEIE